MKFGLAGNFYIRGERIALTKFHRLSIINHILASGRMYSLNRAERFREYIQA